MKTIKSFLACSILLVSTSLFAQHPGGGQRGGQPGPPPIPSNKQIEQMVTDLAGKLSLSADQKTKVLSLYKEHFKQVKEKTSGNSRPRREEMEALDATLAKNVKAVLTQNQKSKYEAYLKSQRKRRPPRRR